MKMKNLFFVILFLSGFCACSYHYAKAPDGTKIRIMRIGKQETKNLSVYKICKDGTSFGLKLENQQSENLKDVIKEAGSLVSPLLNQKVGK